MDAGMSNLVFAMVAWLIGISFGAGGTYLTVRRNTRDVKELRDAQAACQAGFVKTLHEMDKRLTVIGHDVKRLIRIANGITTDEEE
jgi:hypothetical protein